MKKEQLVSAIEQLGFSQKEARLYVAALKLGQGSLTDLCHEAGLKWTITSNLVQNLLRKGLLSEVVRGKHSVYAAVHPRRLQQIATLHENQIEEVLPSLLELRETQVAKPEVRYYVGIEGVTQAYEELFESFEQGKELLWVSDMDAVSKHVPQSVQKYLQTLRKKDAGTSRALVVYNGAGKNYVDEIKKLKIKEHVKLLSKELKLQGSEEALIGDKLYHFVFADQPSVVVWEHSGVVAARRATFEYFWRTGTYE